MAELEVEIPISDNVADEEMGGADDDAPDVPEDQTNIPGDLDGIEPNLPERVTFLECVPLSCLARARVFTESLS